MRPTKRHPLNAPGDFYIEDGCCTACGVMHEQSALLTWDGAYHCYVSRQPTTSVEVSGLLDAMSVGELDCLRYGGDDRSVMGQMAAIGAAHQIDASPADYTPFPPKTHLSVAPKEGAAMHQADVVEILRVAVKENSRMGGDFKLARWHPLIGRSWSIRFSWFGEQYQQVDVSSDADGPGRLLVHLRPFAADHLVGLCRNVDWWLRESGRLQDFRWRTAEQWAVRGEWSEGPI